MKFKITSKTKILYFLLCLFSLGVLLKIYNYLTDLEHCNCYNDVIAYQNLKINIDFLKVYQIFEMFLVVMFISIILCRKSNSMNLAKRSFRLTYLTTAIVLLMTFVTGYLSYNTFLLYVMSKEKCKCVDKWQKYFIYVQGIMGSITFLRLLFLFFVVFLLLLSN